MLRIKKYVSTKKLKEFGYYKDEDFGFVKKIDTSKTSWSAYTIIKINDDGILDAFWEDFGYHRDFDIFPKKYIKDLIKADLVEKVSEGDNE